MDIQLNDLQSFLDEALVHAGEGEVANYIPALGKANANHLSIAIAFPDGTFKTAGDVESKLSLQSISKVMSLALVLMERGEDYVFDRVGKEPTGDPFNSIIKLEIVKPSKPLNPMINAGALVVSHMIEGQSVDERLGRLLDLLRKVTGNPEVTYNKEIAQSEMETADLNRALSYYLKQHGVIQEDIEQLMDLYTKQCAIELNTLELSKVGLLLAMNGKDMITGEQIIPPRIASICKTFMVTCGMYNASGEFAINVGIPAKSGVSGGIMAAVPNKCGIGVFGPSLDEKGNSVAGVALLDNIAEKYELSMF